MARVIDLREKVVADKSFGNPGNINEMDKSCEKEHSACNNYTNDPEEGEILDDYDYIISSEEEFCMRQRIEELEATNAELEKIDKISAVYQSSYSLASRKDEIDWCPLDSVNISNSEDIRRIDQLHTDLSLGSAQEFLQIKKRKRRKYKAARCDVYKCQHKSSRQRHGKTSRRLNGGARKDSKRASKRANAIVSNSFNICENSNGDGDRYKEKMCLLSRKELRFALAHSTNAKRNYRHLKERLEKDHFGNSGEDCNAAGEIDLKNKKDIFDQSINEDPESNSDSISLEEQELRLIALKSAVMKKHLARKKRDAEIAYSPTEFEGLFQSAAANDDYMDIVGIDINNSEYDKKKSLKISPVASPMLPQNFEANENTKMSMETKFNCIGNSRMVDMDICNSEGDDELNNNAQFQNCVPFQKISLSNFALSVPKVTNGILHPTTSHFDKLFPQHLTHAHPPLEALKFESQSLINASLNKKYNVQQSDPISDFLLLNTQNEFSNTLELKYVQDQNTAPFRYKNKNLENDEDEAETLRALLLSRLNSSKSNRPKRNVENFNPLANQVYVSQDDDTEALRSLLLKSMAAKKSQRNHTESILKEAVRRLQMKMNHERTNLSDNQNGLNFCSSENSSFKIEHEVSEYLQAQCTEVATVVKGNLFNIRTKPKSRSKSKELTDAVKPTNKPDNCSFKNQDSRETDGMCGLKKRNWNNSELETSINVKKSPNVFSKETLSTEVQKNKTLVTLQQSQQTVNTAGNYNLLRSENIKPSSTAISAFKSFVVTTLEDEKSNLLKADLESEAKSSPLITKSNTHASQAVTDYFETKHMNGNLAPLSLQIKSQTGEAKLDNAIAKSYKNHDTIANRVTPTITTNKIAKPNKIVKPNKIINTPTEPNLNFLTQAISSPKFLLSRKTTSPIRKSRYINNADIPKVQVKELVIRLRGSDNETSDDEILKPTESSTFELPEQNKETHSDTIGCFNTCSLSGQTNNPETIHNRPNSRVEPSSDCALFKHSRSVLTDCFEEKLDTFLKNVHFQVQQTQNPKGKIGTNTNRSVVWNCSTPVAVRHLSYSAQQEYLRLVQRMQLLEKQKQKKNDISTTEEFIRYRECVGSILKNTDPLFDSLRPSCKETESIFPENATQRRNSNFKSSEKNNAMEAYNSNMLQQYESYIIKIGSCILYNLDKSLKLVEEAKKIKKAKLCYANRMHQLRVEMNEVQKNLKREQLKMSRIFPKICESNDVITTLKQHSKKIQRAAIKYGKIVKSNEYRFNNVLQPQIVEKSKMLAAEIKKINSMKHSDDDSIPDNKTVDLVSVRSKANFNEKEINSGKTPVLKGTASVIKLLNQAESTIIQPLEKKSFDLLIPEKAAMNNAIIAEDENLTESGELFLHKGGENNTVSCHRQNVEDIRNAEAKP